MSRFTVSILLGIVFLVSLEAQEMPEDLFWGSMGPEGVVKATLPKDWDISLLTMAAGYRREGKLSHTETLTLQVAETYPPSPYPVKSPKVFYNIKPGEEHALGVSIYWPHAKNTPLLGISRSRFIRINEYAQSDEDKNFTFELKSIDRFTKWEYISWKIGKSPEGERATLVSLKDSTGEFDAKYFLPETFYSKFSSYFLTDMLIGAAYRFQSVVEDETDPDHSVYVKPLYKLAADITGGNEKVKSEFGMMYLGEDGRGNIWERKMTEEEKLEIQETIRHLWSQKE